MNKTLEKLNSNLKIAIKNKNEKAIEVIKKHIAEIEAKTYVPKLPKTRPCENKSKVVHAIMNKCRYMIIAEEKFNENRPCMGSKVKCSNDKCPIDDWYSAGCNPLKCKFHTRKNKQ